MQRSYCFTYFQQIFFSDVKCLIIILCSYRGTVYANIMNAFFLFKILHGTIAEKRQKH